MPVCIVALSCEWDIVLGRKARPSSWLWKAISDAWRFVGMSSSCGLSWSVVEGEGELEFWVATSASLGRPLGSD